MRRFLSLAPLLIVGLLAGCGSSSSSNSSSASSASTSTSTASAAPTTTTSTSTSSTASASAPSGGLALSETEFKITPKSPAVASAGKVTITVHNDGKITHALAVQTPSGVVKTGPIAAGHSATLTVDLSAAGTYTFYCPIDGHRTLGMVGALKVAGGASASSGGAAAGGGGSSSTSTSSTSPSGGSPY